MLIAVIRFSSPAMAPMLSTMANPSRPFAACDGVFRSTPPSLSLCSAGLEMLRLRARLDLRGRRIACHSDLRTGRRTSSCTASATEGLSPEPSDAGEEQEDQDSTKTSPSLWKNWQMNAGDLKEKVAKLGRAGLLAYGLFNGITYTTFFFIAFLAFEKTGQNPANNLKACLGGMISMWTGNNFTRPLRVAGAAALAPFMDKVMKKTQKAFGLADEASAFLFLVVSLIALCAAAVGLLILSRLGR